MLTSLLNNTKLHTSDLAALGITNQRETALVWDRRSGRPCCNAIVWQDTRTDRIASALDRDGRGDVIRRKAGLPPATYFAPYWRSDARGAIVGLSRFNTNAHVARDALEADSGVHLELLKVDGGITANDLCMQIQADVLGVDVVNPDDLRANWQEDKRWSTQPAMLARVKEHLVRVARSRWREAVARSVAAISAGIVRRILPAL